MRMTIRYISFGVSLFFAIVACGMAMYNIYSDHFMVAMMLLPSALYFSFLSLATAHYILRLGRARQEWIRRQLAALELQEQRKKQPAIVPLAAHRQLRGGAVRRAAGGAER